MMRCPSDGSRPVVSVSRMIWRMKFRGEERGWRDEGKTWTRAQRFQDAKQTSSRRSSLVSLRSSLVPHPSPLVPAPHPSSLIPLPSAQLSGDAAIRELIRAFVAGIAVVAAHPYPLDVVLLDQFVQLHPEIDVLDRFPVRGAPAALFPVVNPGGDAVVHVLGIGVQA